ncbi:TonB-dependent Receptor Plug Domain [Bacteroides luti]|uniref:TonB-dependent Receptor Plug Domain n=1 Tax=Bacteroides luti TaxID=1297750 RepID=A0A1M4UDU2_9BACE|nr:TonB-dependent receptor [Bacteroides luti]SHE54854.1 TonB-dependent Receptor Plug Domain [Bacteroides luti]
MKKIISLIIFVLVALTTVAQQKHSIKGIVIDKGKREPISFASIGINGTGQGAVTDSVGKFNIQNVVPGIYRLQISAVGYNTVLTPEYIISTKDLFITVELEESVTQLGEVSVTASMFRRNPESPVGLRLIGLQEIEKSPGANRDISRIVQNYAGVGYSPVGYRNDLIVRGGGPSENRFYMDGVEIPNINHFSTQGASGGPVGIINADLIREVSFYTGAFPASKGNALSSVLDFKLRDGNMEKNSMKATLGASEFSLTSNGKLSKKTTYLASVRQSYLQFLFKALGLPFLPTYTDAQFKTKTRLSQHNEITFLGLTGIDNMKLNTNLTGEKAEYILSYLPTVKQETFTLGSVYKHYAGAHIQTVVLSHSYLNNHLTKYLRNDESSPDNLTLKYGSLEQETKLRVENVSTFGAVKVSFGANLDHTQYSNNTFQKAYTDQSKTYKYHTFLDMLRWGFFGTMNYESPDERMTVSLGVRGDACNYTSQMNKLNNQLSPRLSLSYQIIGDVYFSGNVGRYYQLPAYTALGYKDNNGIYVNKNLGYITVDQYSAGLTYKHSENLQITAEGFYKKYDNIPFSINDNIPLADKGADYGVVGNEELTPTAQGRSYGIELMAKWIIVKKLNLSSALTLFKSEYRKNEISPYIASSWDNKYIFNLGGTYNFEKNWSFGAKISSIGGAPYTPYDVEKSSLVTAWDAQGRAYYDYSEYNTERLSAYTRIDLRVDKTFYIKKYMLGFYIDLQNITGSQIKQADALMSTGVIENPSAPANQQRYKMKYISQNSGTVIPTLGITFEF